MSQKAVENVLKRVDRLLGWWKEQERMTGKSNKVLTLTKEDLDTLKKDPKLGAIMGITIAPEGAVHYKEFELREQTIPEKV